MEGSTELRSISRIDLFVLVTCVLFCEIASINLSTNNNNNKYKIELSKSFKQLLRIQWLYGEASGKVSTLFE